ncbi:MAG: TIGR02996 domain-containing protein [Myxococcota bacterium]|nr:TIGR02996 domain-containing protein [Myxococcota bacterium]
MPRYELDDQFWQVSCEGTLVTTKHGKIGNKGRSATRYHATPEAARETHDRLVVEQQRAGFRLVAVPEPVVAAVDEPPIDEQRLALEARIDEEPDDVAAYAVYGDWLQRQGHPRGELIALQLAAAAITRDGAIKTRAHAAVGRYLAKHAATLLGELVDIAGDPRDWVIGPVRWRAGFIHHVELGDHGAHGIDEQLARLLRHPSARFLRELHLRASSLIPARRCLEHLVGGAPATLVELELRASAHLGDIAALWPAVPNLERLAITARTFDVGPLEIPAVRRARFLATSLGDRTVAAIARAPWPRLERLELRLCSRIGSTTADFQDLRPLLTRTDLPALTHLKIRGAPFAGAILRELAASPLAGQLQALELSAGNLSPQDLAILIAHRAAFTQLRELVLPFDRLTQPQRASLTGIAKHIIGDERLPIDTLDLDLDGP